MSNVIRFPASPEHTESPFWTRFEEDGTATMSWLTYLDMREGDKLVGLMESYNLLSKAGLTNDQLEKLHDEILKRKEERSRRKAKALKEVSHD